MTFESEQHLCSSFREWIEREEGVEVHNEAAGWDLLVVYRTGKQMGVQAKLKDNLDVLHQAVKGKRAPNAPDVAAVLVPFAGEKFRTLAEALDVKLVVPTRSGFEYVTWQTESPPPDASRRCAVPRLQNECPAGVPSPRFMGSNQEKELRLCAIYRRKGFVNSKDFRSVGMNPKFPPFSWLYRASYNRFEQVIGSQLPDEFHPQAARALAKEARR